MSIHCWKLSGVILTFLLTIVSPGCVAPPPEGEAMEEEDIEAEVLRTAMMRNRGRFEVKGGAAFPLNSEFDSGLAFGLKGMIEAVQKGMWFGLEFDYTRMDSSDPLSRATPQDVFLSADTEEKMDHFDRYQVLLTWDYEIPTGPDLYYPIFRFGIGLGGVAINAQEAPGNPFQKFDDAFMFVAQPTLGFRFPVHENIGLFMEGEYNYIPQIQMTGDDDLSGRNVDIGDDVEFSTINIWGGLSFEW